AGPGPAGRAPGARGCRAGAAGCRGRRTGTGCCSAPGRARCAGSRPRPRPRRSGPAAAATARGRWGRAAPRRGRRWRRRVGWRAVGSWHQVGGVVGVALVVGRRYEVEVLAVIAEDSTAQTALRVGSGRAQALQFDLDLDRIVQLALAVVQVAAADQAHRHAAAFPLQAGDALEQLAVVDRVVVAPHRAPGRRQRVQEIEVHLLQQVAAVAVGQVGDPGVADQVAGTEAGQVLAPVLGVPLVGGAQAPAVVDRVAGVRHPGRLAALHRGLAGHGYPGLVEIADLAEAGRELFASVGLAQQAGRDGQGELVGVGLAVGAGVAVLAEQLAPAEGHRPGVEARQPVLVAVRDPQVEQPGLQGLEVLLAVEARLAVEEQAGVERGDRQAAGRRVVAVAFGKLRVEPVAGVAPGQLRG